MSQGSPADKRQHRRFGVQIPVRFGMEGRMREGAIVDMSEGGVQVRSADSFAVGVVVDIFAQFPRRRLRLRARVAWVRGEPPTMGMSFVKPDRSLIAAYDEWVEETRAATGGLPAGAAGHPDQPSVAPATQVVVPTQPVVRRLETTRGNEFDIRIEKKGAGWRLLIFTTAHRTPSSDPDLDRTFADYTAADTALKEFLKSR